MRVLNRKPAAHPARQVVRIAAAMVAAVVLAIPASAQPRDEAPEDFPQGVHRDDTFYARTACHGFKLVAQQGMNRRQWDESISLMVSKHGMPAPEAADRAKILDYLEAAFPPRTTPSQGGFRNPFAQ
jgi:hypothetical protein